MSNCLDCNDRGTVFCYDGKLRCLECSKKFHGVTTSKLCEECSKTQILCTCDIKNRICLNCNSIFSGSTVGYDYCNTCGVCRQCGRKV